MPARSTASRPMITVKVRCALRTVGSRKALTPLLTASTPVIAVQPFENTCRRSHVLTATVAGPATFAGGAATGTGCPAANTVFVTSDQDGAQQRAEKRVRRNHEKYARFPNAAQIHDRDDHEDAQAKRQRVRLKLRHGGD